jgi:hypothetical protein
VFIVFILIIAARRERCGGVGQKATSLGTVLAEICAG